MKLQSSILFSYNAKQQLAYRNSAQDPLAIAPRFFLGQTKQGNVWRFREDLPNSLINELELLASSEPPLSDFSALPHNFEAFRMVLEKHAPLSRIWHGPAYFFPDAITNPPDVTLITRHNSALLEMAFSYAISEITHNQPCMVMVQDGQAVSLCCSVRRGRYAVEAGVETVAAYRGRGFAAKVVAAWALVVRKLGLIPLYSTSWDNIASQNVARKLGLMIYGVDLHFT